jgi:hypothetical protein
VLKDATLHDRRADGKIDLEQVLVQLQGLLTVMDNQSSRIRTLEEREVVPPSVVASMKEAVDMHDRKIQGLEVQEVGANMRLAELREMIDDLRKNRQIPGASGPCALTRKGHCETEGCHGEGDQGHDLVPYGDQYIAVAFQV